MKRHICQLTFGLLVSVAASFAGAADPALFPRPASLEPAVQFWTRVYTEIGTSRGFIHDNERLDSVYETIHIPSEASRRERNRVIERSIEQHRNILNRLGRGQHDQLNADERRVLDLWPPDVSTAELNRAAQRLRFQLGQANRFRAGLARSGTWRPYIEDVLRERGLPLELAALPHVESSFDPTAYSKVGAAGMWQFTRGTGLRYMRVDHVIDERRDPFISTRAAAQLLADNYAVIESWPLALTAYNHGLAGMRRAAERLKTKDIDKIVANYESRSFGFASRNFYTAFLAAVDVDRDPERYFGQVAMEPASDTQVLRLPDYIGAAELAASLGIDIDTLAAHNPALMRPVWTGDKFVPRGFELRLPGQLPAAERLAAIPAGQRFAAQQPDVYHRVGPGDTMSQIARQYRVSLSSLLNANGLGSRDIIRVGQRITLPGDVSEAVASRVASAAAPAPDVVEDGVYVVRAGDSIDLITRRLGVDAASLLAYNDISNPDRIYAGQRLRVASMPQQPAGRPAAESMAAAISQAASEVSEADAPGPAEPAGEAVAEAASEPVALPAPALGAAIASTYAAIIGSEPAFAGVLDELDAESASALESAQADLAADPSDYTVATTDHSIEVQALETLGHYADWLGIRTQRLRDINRLAFERTVVMGERLKLDFSNVDASAFEQRRVSYHRAQQESFFRSHQIADTVLHTVRPGESLWILASRTYDVPVWLLRQYNPDLDLSQVHPGTVVKFPRLVPIQTDEASPGPISA